MLYFEKVFPCSTNKKIKLSSFYGRYISKYETLDFIKFERFSGTKNEKRFLRASDHAKI